MKWNNEHYGLYNDEIKDNVYRYAFENYVYDPVISQAILPEDYWFGDIFNVSEIERLLNSAIKEAMSKRGIFDLIRQKKYDKFIILPDVFSEKDVQIDYPYGHEYDMDKRNIIYVNNKLFEIVDKKHLHSVKFNFNNKTYIFYKSGTEDGMIDGKNSSLEVISFQEYSFIDEDPSVEDFWDKESRLLLKFTKNRKLYINDENPNEENALIGIMHPYLIFDYHKDFNDEQKIENPRLKLYGLKSFNKDSQIVEKQFLHDPDKLLIHNNNVIFASTAVIIYKNKDFIIENFKFPYNEHIIERFDKHTVEVKKNDDIDKIIIFLMPLAPVDPKYKVDTIYDKVHNHSSKAYMLLKKYNKSTNQLLDLFENKERDVTIEELIEFGYKYDRDVLKIIQASIPTYIHVEKNKSNIFVTDNLLNEVPFLKPKIIVRAPNRIKGFPQLIINNRLISVDYKIIKRSTTDYIVIDPVRTFGINRNDLNVGFLNNYIDKNIDNIEVFFITESFYDEENTVRRPYRVLSDSRINKRINVINTFVGVNPSIVFANGRLTYSKFIDDPNYQLQYGIHRVPILKNINQQPITDYYKYNVSGTPMAGDVGYTATNKSINLLDTERNECDIMLDVSKENIANRTVMILNIPEGSKYNYKVFDNRLVKNEEGYVNKIKQSPFTDSIGINKTVFFDYDGNVIKPEVLTERYIDPKFVSVYSHTARIPNINTKTKTGFQARTNEYFCLHYLNIEPVNTKYGLDLRIDEDRINKYFNKGSYNENVMKDPEVIRLFSYYPKDPNKQPIGSYANEYDSLLNMKLYVSFWYAHNNATKLNTTEEYIAMVKQRPTLFNSDGTPIENKLNSYFNPDENFNIYDSLLGYEVQSNMINDIFKDSNNYISNKEAIDLKKHKYTVKDHPSYQYYIDNGKVILGNIFSAIKK